MGDEELAAWLVLSLTPDIGPARLAKMLSLDSADNIVNYSRKRLEFLNLKPRQIDFIRKKSRPVVESCLEWRQKSNNNHIITLLSPRYPSLLREISAPPSVLFVKGDVGLLCDPQVAIVGSRNASPDGLRNASSLAGDLVQKGITVTSGLALGIDGYAHDGALRSDGDTIAVLGSGLDNIYPARHRKLAARIAERGALVSEFCPDALPKAKHFPRRNRIISGLSLGVLVVEAAERSGSLITARYAGEQGREVFALPGSFNNPNARGGNRLIKEGAHLVQSSNDIIQEIDTLLAWSIGGQKEIFDPEVENEQLPFPELLANVGEEEAVAVDILAQRTHIPVHEIMTQLLELELQGHVAAVSGGYIRMRRG